MFNKIFGKKEKDPKDGDPKKSDPKKNRDPKHEEMMMMQKQAEEMGMSIEELQHQ